MMDEMEKCRAYRQHYGQRSTNRSKPRDMEMFLRAFHPELSERKIRELVKDVKEEAAKKGVNENAKNINRPIHRKI